MANFADGVLNSDWIDIKILIIKYKKKLFLIELN
jgi:hypothetical protein